MTDSKKKKGVKTMRTPPGETKLDDWITGDSNTQTPRHLNTQTPSNPDTQTPDGSNSQQSSANKKPSGAGIVKRADGTYRRRLNVYLDPDRAAELKLRATINHRDMSDIIDDLVAKWLNTEKT